MTNRTSDDPLTNLDDFKIDDADDPVSPLAKSPPVTDAGAAPASDLEVTDVEAAQPPAVAEEGEADPENEEQRLQREAKQAQEKAEKEAEETRQAEKAKEQESDDSIILTSMDLE